MVRHQWTKTVYLQMVIFLITSFLFVGCASHIDKVVPQKLPTMKQIYDEKAGDGGTALLRQREADIRARPISNDEDYLSELPPRAAQINHLFPALPNPELYMYVRPHVVGTSGAAVPAYMTRFTMYDRTHYAMPNEVIAAVKHPGIVTATDTKKISSKNSTKQTSSHHAVSTPHGD
jgi:conjugative transfer region lipoprotein (TIGR03751 family)